MQINDVLLQLRCGTSAYPNTILLYQLTNLLLAFKTLYRVYRRPIIYVINALIVLTILLTSPACISQSNSSLGPVPKQTFLTSEQRHQLRMAMQDSSSFTDPYVAEVWLVDMSTRLKPFIKDPKTRLNFLKIIHREAKRTQLPVEILLAIIHTESSFQQFALSSVGAQGYMQVMPFWIDEIGQKGDNLFETETNLKYGTAILKHYYQLENGNWYRALGRYNGSLGQSRYPDKVFDKLHKIWFRR